MARFQEVGATPRKIQRSVCDSGWIRLACAARARLAGFRSRDGRVSVEGQWPRGQADPSVDLRVDSAAAGRAYRVHVAPMDDRERFILIEARDCRRDGWRWSLRACASASRLAPRPCCRAIPKAFVYPVAQPLDAIAS